MGIIRRLPPDLATQIAAGEVVERPASVVKELVENALDAGATRIGIAVEFGGKRLIRVEDDGGGMDPEDARLALERHATSKIGRVDDLAAVRTLGFRGEALPSIASVSHFRLRTRTAGAHAGTEVRVNGGAMASVMEVGAPNGTLVEVSDLFYNVPARRKFLKSDAAESTQVSRIVVQLALGFPETGFTLTSAGRVLLQCAPVTTRRERLFQLYGERGGLLEVQREVSGLRLRGFVAGLADGRAIRGPQNIFVNRRIVKDRTVSHAIAEAYSAASIKERRPEAHLFLEVPPDRVDVNVHPTKAEVRFLEQSLVHEIVRRALADALGKALAPELQLRPQDESVVAGAASARPLPGVLSDAMWTDSVPAAALPETRPASGESQASGMLSLRLRPMVPLGQFRRTFIIAVDDEGVSIVDQHVAHERILFERAMSRLADGSLESQRLLEPIVVDLPPPNRQVLLEHAAELHRVGFDIEEFGGGSIHMTAVPAILDQGQSVAAVRALGQDLDGLDRTSPLDEILRRIAATTACHAAVKANDPLTMEKMTHILEELHRTAYSTVCPHGRPVVLRLTRREIEKNFQRA